MLRPGTLQWKTLSCSESSCSTAVTMYGIIILLYFVFFFKLQELTSVKKQSPGLMSRMSDSMRNMASSWMLKNREPEFQEMAEYIKTFREKMLVLETISDKIAKDRFGKKKCGYLLLHWNASFFDIILELFCTTESICYLISNL